MLSKIRCGMHRLPRGFPLPSAADLQFLDQLPQSSVRNVKWKAAWKHGLARAASEVRVIGLLGGITSFGSGHERTRGRIGEMPQVRQGAPPLPWDNLSGRLQPHRSSTDNVSTTMDPDHATTRTGDRGGAHFERTGLGPTQLPKYRRLRPLARRL